MTWWTPSKTRTGTGSLAMLTGGPGSGKTRTAEELVTYARLRGVEVHRGSCHDDQGAPAFWPWIQILRSCTQGRDRYQLAEMMGSGATELASLDPEIARRLAITPAPHAAHSEQARFRLFDAAVTFLTNICRQDPCLIVLDDLHAADHPSLRLLSYLAGILHDCRLIVLGTYRDGSIDGRHPLTRTVGELAGKTPLQRIELPGLSEEDVGQFPASILGAEPPRWLATNVWTNNISEQLRPDMFGL